MPLFVLLSETFNYSSFAELLRAKMENIKFLLLDNSNANDEQWNYLIIRIVHRDFLWESRGWCQASRPTRLLSGNR